MSKLEICEIFFGENPKEIPDIMKNICTKFVSNGHWNREIKLTATKMLIFVHKVHNQTMWLFDQEVWQVIEGEDIDELFDDHNKEQQ